MNYLLPGILLITIASGISYTAFRLFLDMQSGIFERFQSMPIARSSVLWAHVLTSLVANLVSVVVVVLVALLMGFRTGAGVLAWLAVAGILILFTLALTWIAVIPGLSAKTVGRRERVLLPADLPAVHQLGVRAHRHDARPGRAVRREPAGDRHRQHDPRPVRRSSRSAATSGSPSPGVVGILVVAYALRHGDLPPQDRLKAERLAPVAGPPVRTCPSFLLRGLLTGAICGHRVEAIRKISARH